MANYGKESKPTTGWEMWEWPEFKAFAERLGINYDGRIIEMSIEITEGAVTLTEIRPGRDHLSTKEPAGVHNSTDRHGNLIMNSAGESIKVS